MSGPHFRLHRPPTAIAGRLLDPEPTAAAAMAECPQCGEPLVLSQPDEDIDLFVGACVEGCKRWFVVHTTNDFGSVRAAEIPIPDQLRVGAAGATSVPAQATSGGTFSLIVQP